MLTQPEIEKLKYPVGKFTPPSVFSREEAGRFIKAMEAFPAQLENTLAGIQPAQLNFGYRPGSWNIRQIVHHVADSHLNFHIRLRLSLTEDKPTVKPYDENSWARLVDYDSDDLSSSLDIIRGVHKRSVDLLKTLQEKDFGRTFYHPEHKKEFDLRWLLSLYAWHGTHHAGQIKAALEHKF
jgi:uncharacterized damage-inducible protein DinB